MRKFLNLTAIILASFAIVNNVFSEGATVVDGATITYILVNGGVDSPNQGTTCFQIDKPIPSVCAGNIIGIKNNNKELLAALLHAKATGKQVWLYFETQGDSNHCAGHAFTPCTVNSIGLR